MEFGIINLKSRNWISLRLYAFARAIQAIRFFLCPIFPATDIIAYTSTMIPDCELLRQYAEGGDEAAFAELVRRYVDLVYSAAWRQVGGDAHLAQDVAQGVFTELARQARKLCRHANIVGWIYTTTRFTANNLRRREHRRRLREQEAYAMQTTPSAPEPNWAVLQPMLDEAVCALSAADREAVLLRFFQNKQHGEIGSALGLSEDAARKRVDRALEKLRVHFTRRGVTVSTALLAAAITANSVQAAPATLAVTLTGGALTGVGQTGLIHSLLKIISMTTKTKAVLLAMAAVAAMAAVPLALQQRELTRVQAELADARHAPTGAAVVHSAAAPKSLEERIAAMDNILKLHSTRAEMARNLLDLFSNFKADDFLPLLDVYRKRPQSSLTGAALSLLLAVWATSHPADALAWVNANIHGANRHDYLNNVFQSWAAKDGHAAMVAINGLSDPAERAQMQNEALVFMSLNDPQGAFALLRQLPLSRQTPMSTASIFAAWALTDPTAAAAAALNLPASEAQLGAVPTIALIWAQQDSAAALAWAAALPAGKMRSTAVAEVVVATAQNDPATAATYLADLPNGANRNQLVANIASSWATTDPAAAIAWASTVAQGHVQDQAVESILSQMDRTDPAAAAAVLANITSASVRDTALPQLAAIWAETDAQSALAWAQSLPVTESDARATAIQNVLKGWIQSDPVGAAAYVQNLSADSNFRAISDEVAKSWAQADPQAALKWVMGLPADGSRDNAARTVLTSFADVDPQAAWNLAQQVDWATSTPTDGSNGIMVKTQGNIAIAWSTQDPAQAAAVIATLPDGNVANNAIPAVAANWLQQDPEAASQWIDGLPHGAARDGAVVQLISMEGKNNPPAAFKWAMSMADKNVRGGQIQTAIAIWAKTDPAAATVAAESNNFTDGFKAGLLSLIGKNAPAGFAPASSAGAGTPAN